ncbi:RNA polymerase sigma factor [Tichowtungia aerotolerans]|uniref:RNA polymerase sigma factor n=1 Tax=Tichowtungia aerotolerans TaxID=2697043 RepID=A0A6P1M799_9BACT|nr:sigma-70 family RNA polymerase sigma factor [Tichowtungia aerotolerans]QHI68913.1 sigma-70 family RNA polymerase sigma factor [Tichowtungia aerotolerans]
MTDLDLIRRARLEDTSAYEELVRRYYSKIYGLVYGMVSSREDAEDVTQEVFVKAWKALGHFREQSGFYTWIYRIAVNRAINFRKRRNRRRTVQFEDFDPDIKQAESYKEFSSKGSVLRKMNLGEFQKKMNEALMTLSDKHRAVVIMHDVQGMPHSEIAEVMGCSEGTARSRLFYARKRLQAELAEFES